MKKDEREFLEEILSLTLDSIGEHREHICDGVSISLPPEHPLHQMRLLLADRLRLKNGIHDETEEKIKESAKLRSKKTPWSVIEQRFDVAFVRDLKAGRRYNERFNKWLAAFQSIDGL